MLRNKVCRISLSVRFAVTTKRILYRFSQLDTLLTEKRTLKMTQPLIGAEQTKSGKNLTNPVIIQLQPTS